MDQVCSVRQQSRHCSLQVGHLQGKADLASDSATDLNAVNCVSLLFVKDLQRGSSQVEN